MEIDKKLSKARLWRLANPEKHKAWKQAWDAKHPGKQLAYSRKYHAAHRERLSTGRQAAYWVSDQARENARERHMKRIGITTDDFNALHAAQGGTCAICRNPETAGDRRTGIIRRLTVDHDHTTGFVRGLLCRKCNTAIGIFQDNITLIEAAIDYLSAEKPTGLQYRSAPELLSRK